MAPNISSRFGTGWHQMGGGWRHCTWQIILASSCCPMCLMASMELSLSLSIATPTDVIVAWSVRLSVCLSHSCNLLKPLYGVRCHLSQTILYRQGRPSPHGSRDLGVGNLRLPRCLLSPNYFGPCLFFSLIFFSFPCRWLSWRFVNFLSAGWIFFYCIV